MHVGYTPLLGPRFHLHATPIHYHCDVFMPVADLGWTVGSPMAGGKEAIAEVLSKQGSKDAEVRAKVDKIFGILEE
jgi:hypothetical protein